MTSPVSGPDDPIEAYLDQLLLTGTGTPREVRHRLAEAEAHLEDAAVEGERGGLGRATARAEAVRRMGPPEGLREHSVLGFRVNRLARRQLVLAGLLAAGVGGLALGLAAILTALAQAIWGANAVAAAFPPGTYTARDCATWLAGDPGAHGCVQAQMADHAGDVIRNMVAGLILGILALALRWLLARRWRGGSHTLVVRSGVENIVGFLAALAVTVVCAAEGVDTLSVTRGHQAGQFFALAISAAVAATYFAVRNAHAKGEVLA